MLERLLPLVDPGMLERLLCPDPLGGVHCQHLVDEVLGLRRDRVPLGRGEVVRSSSDLSVELLLILVPERRVANQEDVQDDSTRPYVHRLSIWLLFQHFW